MKEVKCYCDSCKHEILGEGENFFLELAPLGSAEKHVLFGFTVCIECLDNIPLPKIMVKMPLPPEYKPQTVHKIWLTNVVFQLKKIEGKQ